MIAEDLGRTHRSTKERWLRIKPRYVPQATEEDIDRTVVRDEIARELVRLVTGRKITQARAVFIAKRLKRSLAHPTLVKERSGWPVTKWLEALSA
jgi:hypothetical protein